MSILLYALFICSTRTNNVFFNIFITLLAANFLIKSYTDSLDPEKFKERIKKLNKIATYCGRLSIVILVIGLVLYYGEKKIEYKDTFNKETFFLGIPNCKGHTDKYSYTQMIKSAFS